MVLEERKARKLNGLVKGIRVWKTIPRRNDVMERMCVCLLEPPPIIDKVAR